MISAERAVSAFPAEAAALAIPELCISSFENLRRHIALKKATDKKSGLLQTCSTLKRKPPTKFVTPTALRVCTWNIHGNAAKGGGGIRRRLVSTTLQQRIFDLLFLQEVRSSFARGHPVYNYEASSSEAGILYNKKAVELSNAEQFLEDLRFTTVHLLQPSELWKCCLGTNALRSSLRELLFERTFKARSTICIARFLGNLPTSAIIVSYHGVKTRVDVCSETDALFLLGSLAFLQDTFSGLPVLVGGDFNCHVPSLLQQHRSLLAKWKCAVYTPSKRRRSAIDFLLVRNTTQPNKSCNTRLNLLNAQPLYLHVDEAFFGEAPCVYSNKQESLLVQYAEKSSVCDHDPVVADLLLS